MKAQKATHFLTRKVTEKSIRKPKKILAGSARIPAC